MTYLIPTPPRPLTGTDRAHIDDHGKPACGCSLAQPYAVSGWLMAYRVCEECERVKRSGQMGLFAEVGHGG